MACVSGRDVPNPNYREVRQTAFDDTKTKKSIALSERVQVNISSGFCFLQGVGSCVVKRCEHRATVPTWPNGCRETWELHGFLVTLDVHGCKLELQAAIEVFDTQILPDGARQYEYRIHGTSNSGDVWDGRIWHIQPKCQKATKLEELIARLDTQLSDAKAQLAELQK